MPKGKTKPRTMRILNKEIDPFNRHKIQLMTKNIDGLKSNINDLEERNKKLQFLIIDDILTAREAASTYIGNEYQDYRTAITEIDKKYMI